MNHLMLDIETMGVNPGAAVVSIGAVQFDIETGELGKEFYSLIDLQSCLDAGLKIEAKTLLWWMKQSKEAQSKLYSDGSHSLKDALIGFNDFMVNIEKDERVVYPGVQLWGNSARFDLGILEACHFAVNRLIPWNSWIERDLRTINFLLPDIRNEFPFEGIKHYPIDDCKHQIKYLCEIYKRLIK